ncbi:hypothetical protein Tco_0433145 [Tanacetum coccineum]
MSETQDENPPPPPPPATQQTPHTVSTIKLPILKKGEYDIWAMKLEHYLAYTDYLIWEVIQNGNGPVSVTTDTLGQLKILPPKTAEEIVKLECHQIKIGEMMNPKRSRSTSLTQQFEGFTVSNTDGIHKGYERFQSLLSQLEIHGAGVSTEDANQKFPKSLPVSWFTVSLNYEEQTRNGQSQF